MTTSYKILYIDLETYSNIDITEVGSYRYIDDDSFEILLLAYAFDDEPVSIVDLALGDSIPDRVLSALSSADVVKHAHNANFERNCLAKWLGVPMPPEQWRCSAVRCRSLGLPGALGDAGKALKLGEDKAKLKIGKSLITYFCKPCKPTKANGGRTRNLPHHDIEKWETFIEYCIRDVETERTIETMLDAYAYQPEVEQALWCLDQHINDRGVRIDIPLVRNVLKQNQQRTEELIERAKELTGLDNPNSVVALKNWIKSKTGSEVASLDKESVYALLQTNLPNDVRELLCIRRELGKSSIAKYTAMWRSVCKDFTVKGMLMFYGANRTGRWSGRIVQLHNLPQNHLDDIKLDRHIVRHQPELIELIYDNQADLFSQLIRTCFVPMRGNTFVVCDYSAIEARVIAWLSGEQWVLDTFLAGEDIYCKTASMMYGVEVKKNGINGELRVKGKIATLACGYQGGVGALDAMDRRGEIPEAEKQEVINKWRNANPKIVAFWSEVEKSAMKAIEAPGSVIRCGRIKFKKSIDTLFIYLPNGRYIAYKDARIEPFNTNYGMAKRITYLDALGARPGALDRVETYGGKLVENIVQATARDALGIAMLKLDSAGYMIRFHVHDEVIVEVEKDKAKSAIEEIKQIMALSDVSWCEGLPLKAEGYITDFYMKD